MMLILIIHPEPQYLNDVVLFISLRNRVLTDKQIRWQPV